MTGKEGEKKMQTGFVSIKRVERMNDPLDGKKVQNVAGATCGSGGGCNSENKTS